jgi:hypothetical protein
LELGKAILPIIYRSEKWTGKFESLVDEIQTIDLRSGSYTDNFQKLVDGLTAAGAVKATGERPFLRRRAIIPLNMVFSKIPGWAFAWSLGWLVFWAIVLAFIAILVAIQGGIKGQDLLNFTLILICGAVGGFAGGLLAGLFTMLALRPNAPSISWKHMSPTVRIWGISGPLGMIVSGIITATMIAIGAISVQGIEPNCGGIGFGDCMGQIIGSALGEAIGLIILTMFVFLLFVIVAWFLTGTFAGWLAVRHIRKLEPGITKRQARGVSVGWGCGAIVAALVMFILLAIITSVLGR